MEKAASNKAQHIVWGHDTVMEQIENQLKVYGSWAVFKGRHILLLDMITHSKHGEYMLLLDFTLLNNLSPTMDVHCVA